MQQRERGQSLEVTTLPNVNLISVFFLLMTRHSQLLPEKMLWFSTSVRRNDFPPSGPSKGITDKSGYRGSLGF